VGLEGGFFGWNGNSIARVPCKVERRAKMLPRTINPPYAEKKAKQWPMKLVFGLVSLLLIAASVLNAIQYERTGALHERAGELRVQTIALQEEREQLATEVSLLTSIISEHEEVLERSRVINDRAMDRIAELRTMVTLQRFPGLAGNSGEAQTNQGVSGQ